MQGSEALHRYRRYNTVSKKNRNGNGNISVIKPTGETEILDPNGKPIVETPATEATPPASVVKATNGKRPAKEADGLRPNKNGEYWCFIQVPRELKAKLVKVAEEQGYDSDLFYAVHTLAKSVDYTLVKTDERDWTSKGRSKGEPKVIPGFDKETTKKINEKIKSETKKLADELREAQKKMRAEYAAKVRAEGIAALEASLPTTA